MSAPAQRSNNLARLVFSLVLLVGALFVALNRQPLLDQLALLQFKPSPAIAAIADRAALSDEGIHFFYISRPELLGRDAFNSECRSAATEHTAILGCYTGGRIYLFDINNEKLDGIKEVTAAHEMLHAAYERLPENEKSRINGLLEQQSLGADKERIDELMAEYAKSEPGERLNELHSILGSEIRTLSPELETYYKQYFSDRSQLVALSEQYQTVFAELKNRQESLVSELDALADRIDQESLAYKRNLQVLESDIESFNTRASSGNMTREQYDSERATLEARQTSLRSDYDDFQALIDEYEGKRTELAAINSESTALNRSINSSLTPVPEGAFNG